jgi:hypothetical protein
MANQVDTHAGLLRQIRNDLRLQHPEWIQPNGQSPMCDFYEARLIELLDSSIPRESSDNTVAVTDVPTLPAAENSMAAIL